MKLSLRPVGLRAANAWIDEIHRHHGAVRGHKFSISVVDNDGQVRGVAVAGRPVARNLDDGQTLEVLRLATDGTPNACSMLYGACARAGKAMGYPTDRIITYTLASEPGTSLEAAGWVRVATTGGGSWSRPSRPRSDHHPLDEKVRWHASKPAQLGDPVTPAPDIEDIVA